MGPTMFSSGYAQSGWQSANRRVFLYTISHSLPVHRSGRMIELQRRARFCLKKKLHSDHRLSWRISPVKLFAW